MDREFWLERWKSNQLGWHREEVNPHLADFWPEMPVPAEGRVFVPLCGKSVDLHWLAARGHPAVGVELSRQACDDFYAEHGLTPEIEPVGDFLRYHAGGVEILCGDFFHLEPGLPEPVAGVFDRASLIALPPEMRPGYADTLETLLPGRPPVLLVTIEYPQPEMEGPPFSVGEEEVATLFGGSRSIQRLRDWDVLAESPRFREQGLTELHEKVFRLSAG